MIENSMHKPLGSVEESQPVTDECSDHYPQFPTPIVYTALKGGKEERQSEKGGGMSVGKKGH